MEAALERLIPGLQSIYGDLLVSVILYGSAARGTDTDESDVDIALILNGGATPEMYDQLLELVVDLEIEYGKVFSLIRIDAERFREWETVMPYYRSIRQEGVVLWQAA